MVEEVHRELGVIKEHITDKKMRKLAVDGKKSWLVMLLRGELSYSALVKSKVLSKLLLGFSLYLH